MPIDYKKYPKNWKTEIRPAVMARAKCKCEKCGLDNYSVGWRQDRDGQFVHAMEFKTSNGKTPRIYETYEMARTNANRCNRELDSHLRKLGITKRTTKYIVIVLTIAHLNHDITDNRMENLMALCQRCHNVMDAPYRAKNRAKNRK